MVIRTCSVQMWVCSNSKYKGEIGDILENYPKDFIGVCREVNGRWWIPTIYNTEKYAFKNG